VQQHLQGGTSSREDDGTLGTYCIYEAESPEALRAHAEKSGFGADDQRRRRHRDHPA
jgi:hypothetical protein